MNPHPRTTSLRLAALAAAALLSLLPACAAQPEVRLVDASYTGQYGQARAYLEHKIGVDNKGHKDSDHVDRDYLLDRMRLMLTMLADGYAPSNNRLVERVYDLLRRQGINSDKTVSSVVLNEDLKIWKGEPFEQAMAFHYIAVYSALTGSWDNARASIGNSLFQLRDFGKDQNGQPLSSEQLVRNASRGGDKYFDSYKPTPSDFTLGYLMAALANQQLAIMGDPNRTDEANQNFDHAVAVDPRLQALVQQFRTGQYNTILVVDAGLGPQKVATGPDGAIAAFAPRVASDNRGLAVTVNGEGGFVWPWVCDVNRMALDHRWKNLEDLRVAKSLIGTGLMVGGGAAALYGMNARNDTAAFVGLGLLAAGAIAKAGAHADTRHCELMPQRVYVLPVRITRPGSNVTLQLENSPQSRLVLTGLGPPAGSNAQLRYVRLVGPTGYSPPWTAPDRVLYANDATGPTAGPQLPYILGGHCVRTPSQQALDDYRKSGFLRETTVEELAALYRAEGIAFDVREEGGVPGLHLLEGGRSLASPLAGTLGFNRLYCQEHPAYQPRSREAQELAARLAPAFRAATGAPNNIAPGVPIAERPSSPGPQ
ncbi:MAG: hypothetical protein NTW19_01840 [Planctomycetota bacterium]|nr:hypothetical protein [Planctomycetota bacterium]